jgi:crotonobetainyl-CoA:carnitine CoA-transferase CaiB-like acyl-CoA transferase
VIKVELPGGGDTHRGRNPKYEGYGPSFRALNRNKKSVTLDLRQEKGREILLKLLTTADIFLKNFRPPTRTKLALDYEELAKINPKLVHCSISGYGQSGPISRQARLRHHRSGAQRHDESGHRSR